MAVNYISPYIQRVFIQTQPSLRVLSNTSGTWNPAGAQLLRVNDNGFKANPVEPKTAIEWKHGTASSLPKILGRKSGSFSLSTPIVPSGTQATAPDADILFQGLFGGPGVLTTGTIFGNAWVYNLYDQSLIPFALLGFNHNFASIGNFYSLGNACQRLSVALNGNLLEMTINGISVTVVQNEVFSVVDTIAQGGLNTYPAEPGTYSINGNLMPGFGGQFFVNGVAILGMVDGFTLDFTTGISLKGDYYDDAYPASPVYGKRSGGGTVMVTNTDAASLTTLKQIARNNTAVPVLLTLGTTPGYRVFFSLGGMQFQAPDTSDNNGLVQLSFSSSTSVSPGLANDLSIGFG